MLFCETSPNGTGVGELLLEWDDLAAPRRGHDAEPIGKARPHPVPAKNVSVDNVEGLIAGCCSRCSPFEVTSEETCVRHVGETVPLCCRTRKEEGTAGLSADGGVDSEGD